MPEHDKYTGLHAGSINEGSGMDDVQRELIEERLNRDPNEQYVVGNLADLQRAGAPGGPDTVGEAAAESVPYQEAEDAAKASKKAKK